MESPYKWIYKPAGLPKILEVCTYHCSNKNLVTCYQKNKIKNIRSWHSSNHISPKFTTEQGKKGNHNKSTYFFVSVDTDPSVSTDQIFFNKNHLKGTIHKYLPHAIAIGVQ